MTDNANILSNVLLLISRSALRMEELLVQSAGKIPPPGVELSKQILSAEAVAQEKQCLLRPRKNTPQSVLLCLEEDAEENVATLSIRARNGQLPGGSGNRDDGRSGSRCCSRGN